MIAIKDGFVLIAVAARLKPILFYMPCVKKSMIIKLQKINYQSTNHNQTNNSIRIMKRKPTVGETLFSLNVGNAARQREQVLTPATVIQVGKKYFTAKVGHSAITYRLSDWKQSTEYSAESELFETEQEYADKKEAAEICRMIGSVFTYGDNTKNLSIEQLRAIAQIINQSA